MADVDTWSVAGVLKTPGGFVLTSYGHKTDKSAREVASQIMPLCRSITITHMTKAGGKRGGFKINHYDYKM